MRNYIRYIVVLVLIIAGALLLISVINKFTEPDVSKVTFESLSLFVVSFSSVFALLFTLDVEPTEDKDTTNESNGDTTASAEEVTPDSPNPSISTTTPETDNVTVPNTGTKENIAFIVIGLITITTGIAYIKKHSNN